jgi:heat shock protein HslJ
MYKLTIIISTLAFAFYFTSTKDCSSQATDSAASNMDTELVGTHWKLTELNGNPVEAGQSAAEPHIVLEIEGNRFHGNAGCNRVSGSWQVAEEGKISFSQMVATRMMCLNMAIEDQFLKVFDLTVGFSITDNILTLINANEVPLARFEAHAK